MRSKKGTKVDTSMRLTKGTKVEVLNLKELPSGSWRCAEIVSGNGRTYQVKYDGCLSAADEVMERVPRKAIRPCPPAVKSSRSWLPGDIIEVFENNSWRLAEVSKLSGASFYLVRLLGTFREVKAHAANIRLRQSWQDNRWAVIEKEPRKCNSGVTKGQSKIGNFWNQMSQSFLRSRKRGNELTFEEDRHDFASARTDFSSTMKKIPCLCLPPPEDGVPASRKIRIIESRGRRQPVDVPPLYQPLKQVEAVASPHKMPGGTCIPPSLQIIGATESLETDSDWANPSRDRYFFLGSLDTSITESVSSCSVNNDSKRSADHPMIRSDAEFNSQNDDDNDEVSNGSRREPTPTTKETLPTEVHHQELLAYRGTLTALYASGPLNWEKESLLTNLRLMLHVSNDEHLLESGCVHYMSVCAEEQEGACKACSFSLKKSIVSGCAYGFLARIHAIPGECFENAKIHFLKKSEL